MPALEILAVIGVIGYVIYRQVRGEPLRGRRAVLLPAILTVIGFTDLRGHGGAHLQTADVTALVIGTAGSAVIGLALGAATRLERRDDYLWARLPLWGLALWAALFAWRGVTIALAHALHANVAASSATLLFSLGVNRLAQAAVIVPRAMAAGIPFAPEKNGSVFLSGAFERSRSARPARVPDEDGDRYTPYDLGAPHDHHFGHDERHDRDGYDRHEARDRYDRFVDYDRQDRQDRDRYDRRDRHDRHDRRDRDRHDRYDRHDRRRGGPLGRWERP